jgi:hypothetical protein
MFSFIYLNYTYQQKKIDCCVWEREERCLLCERTNVYRDVMFAHVMFDSWELRQAFDWIIYIFWLPLAVAMHGHPTSIKIKLLWIHGHHRWVLVIHLLLQMIKSSSQDTRELIMSRVDIIARIIHNQDSWRPIRRIHNAYAPFFIAFDLLVNLYVHHVRSIWCKRWIIKLSNKIGCVYRFDADAGQCYPFQKL